MSEVKTSIEVANYIIRCLFNIPKSNSECVLETKDDVENRIIDSKGKQLVHFWNTFISMEIFKDAFLSAQVDYVDSFIKSEQCGTLIDNIFVSASTDTFTDPSPASKIIPPIKRIIAQYRNFVTWTDLSEDEKDSFSWSMVFGYHNAQILDMKQKINNSLSLSRAECMYKLNITRWMQYAAFKFIGVKLCHDIINRVNRNKIINQINGDEIINFEMNVNSTDDLELDCKNFVIHSAQHPAMSGTAKPLEFNCGLAKPLEGNCGLAKPLEGNCGLAKPLEGNYGLAKPLEGNYGLAKPLEINPSIEPLSEISFQILEDIIKSFRIALIKDKKYINVKVNVLHEDLLPSNTRIGTLKSNEIILDIFYNRKVKSGEIFIRRFGIAMSSKMVKSYTSIPLIKNNVGALEKFGDNFEIVIPRILDESSTF